MYQYIFVYAYTCIYTYAYMHMLIYAFIATLTYLRLQDNALRAAKRASAQPVTRGPITPVWKFIPWASRCLWWPARP